MNRRFSRHTFLVLSVNVGLAAGIGMLGCGEARPGDDSLADEVPNGIVGTLHALIASYDDHAETTYRLVRDDGEEIALDFGASGPRVRPGQRIAVRGIRTANRIEVDGYDIVRGRGVGESRQPLKGPAKRNFRIAAISLDANVDAAKMKTRIFADKDSPAAFYRDNSYGDWTMEGDVFGPYTVPIANCQESNLWNIAADAKAAAAADGIDPGKYDNFMYFVPASAGCSWGGIAEVGVNEVRGFINAVNSWYRGTGCVVLAQELGHNYGLLHSHKCTNSPYTAKTYGGSTSCPGFSEYGDPYTPMGGGCGHFNAPESAAQGFISGCNTLDVTSSGTFEIGPIEAKCSGPQVIRVANNAMANYGPQYIFVEYRKGRGSVDSDSKSPAGLYFHASAEYGGNHTDIIFDGGHDFDYALDPFYIHDPIAAVDTTWTEPSSNTTFKLTAIGDTATIEVTIPGTTAGAAKCIDGATPPAVPMCAPLGTTDGGTTIDAGREAGAPDSGGMAGAAGAGMAGGAPDGGSTGGSAGSGGTGGSGGSTTGTGGSGGSSDDGCGCSIPGGNASTRNPLLLLGLAAAVPALRRRRSQRPS